MAVGLPFGTVTQHGRDVPAAIERIRRETPEIWPVIMGAPEDVARIIDTVQYVMSDDSKAPRGSLEALAGFDLDAWQSKAYDRVGAYPGQPRRETMIPGSMANFFPREPVAHLDYSGNPLPEVVIGLPEIAEAPWQLFSLLQYGYWNSYPAPLIHLAVHRRWAERYGAKPVGVTADTLELALDTPPARGEAALAEAKLAFAYCPDAVDQGAGSVDALAEAMATSRHWWFWWD